MDNFGQTPIQLFKAKHPRRERIQPLYHPFLHSPNLLGPSGTPLSLSRGVPPVLLRFLSTPSEALFVVTHTGSASLHRVSISSALSLSSVQSNALYQSTSGNRIATTPAASKADPATGGAAPMPGATPTTTGSSRASARVGVSVQVVPSDTMTKPVLGEVRVRPGAEKRCPFAVVVLEKEVCPRPYPLTPPPPSI